MNNRVRWILLITFLLFGANVAQAESGSYMVTDSQVKTNYSNSNGVGPITPNWDTFLFSNGNWDSISRLEYLEDSGVLGFAHQSNGTAFSCYYGCVGTGTVSYDAVNKRITWLFDPGFSVTSGYFKVNYAVNIFLDVSTTVYDGQGSNAVTTAKPIMVNANGASNYSYGGSYTAAVSTTTTESYVVSYPVSGYFSASITKGTKETIDSFENSSSVIWKESVLNTENIVGHIDQYTAGLWINSTLSSGAYTKTLINATNASGVSHDVTKPSSGASIAWASKSYILGDQARFSWAVSDADWVWYKRFAVKYYDPDAINVATEFINIGSQMGNYSFTTKKAGNYTAYICQDLVFICDNLGSDTMGVMPKSSSYILVNNTVQAGVLNTVTAVYGYNPLNLYGTTRIDVNYFNPTTNKYYLESTSCIVATCYAPSANIYYTVNIKPHNEGQYRIDLIDTTSSNPGGILASRYVTSVAAPLVTSIDVLNSYVNLSRHNFSYGEVLAGDYAVNTTNFTSYKILLEIVNLDRNIKTMSVLITDPIGTFSGIIKTSDQNCFYGISCVVENNVIPAISGYNQIKIVAKNDTFTDTLATNTFTVQDVDLYGYGIKTKPTACVKTAVEVQVFMPGPSNLSIESSDGRNIRTFNLNRSGSVTWKPTFIDIYNLNLKDGAVSKFTSAINITGCEGNVTVTPVSGVVAGGQVADLLANNVFWSFIFTAGMMIAVGIVASKRNSDPVMPMGITGYLGIAAFSLLTWLPYWIIFSITILIFITYAWQQANKPKIGGG